MIRLLFLTTELPWPLDGGGKLRSFETLACLSRFARVKVLSLSESGDGAAALGEALPGVEVLSPVRHPIRIRRDPVALARTALRAAVHREPYLSAKFRSRRYLAAARELVATARPGLVWCDHLNVFAMARAAAGSLPLVLDEHNVESALFTGAAGAGPLARLSRLEGRRAARFESAALRAADRVVAISEEDAVALRELGGGPRVVTILPSIGEAPALRPPPPADGPVSFLGSLSWPPNAEAAAFLAREVLPELRRRLPGARLVIGGKGLPQRLAQELAATGATLAGYVPDADLFLRASAVVAVPVLSGSGISMKLLDSLRACVPTVATSTGARGLALRDGEELLLANGPGAFAAATARLLTDPALRQRVVAGAHRYLLAHHVRAALVPAYERVVEGALLREHA